MSHPSSTSGKFVMPRPPIGPVVWAPHISGPWYPALVTGLGQDAVELTVFVSHSRGSIPRSGVRHVSDPKTSREADQVVGVWDFTDSDKKLAALSELVASLS